MENGKIQPRTDPKPLNRLTKFKTDDYICETTPVQNFMQKRPLGASRQMGEI